MDPGDTAGASSFSDWGSGAGASVGAASLAPTGVPGPPAARAMRYPLASWWSRVGAVLLDALLLLLPYLGAIIVFHQYQKTYYITTTGGIGTSYTTHNTWIESVLWLGYVFIVLCRSGGHNGQTLGKQGTKIRVVRNDGLPVDPRTVLVREGVGKVLPGVLAALSPVILVLVAIYVLLDYLWPLWERENRALHDLLAHTHVVFRDEPVRYFEPGTPTDALRAQPGADAS